MMYSLALILASMIWGSAFVAQSTGGDLLGAWTMNGVRSVIACTVLFAAVRVMDFFKPERRNTTPENRKKLWKAGICSGLALFMASSLQQFGIVMGDSAGKAGFLTACYIVLVPIFSIFLGKKCKWNVWVSALMTLGGLFLLCVKGDIVLALPDILLLLCAAAFSVQILVIDQLGGEVDAVKLSCIQFGVVGVLSILPMLFSEILPDPAAWVAPFARMDAWVALLYAAVMSSGVAYTLQIIGQRGLHPAVASLLMSLESVFAALSGWLILGEQMSGRELIGCAVIFAAVILAQIPIAEKQR